METDAYVHGQKISGGIEQIRETLALQLSSLRNLLQAGARKAPISRGPGELQCVRGLFDGSFPVGARFGTAASDRVPILEKLHDEMEAVNAAIGRVCNSYPAATQPREVAARPVESAFRASGRKSQRDPRRTRESVSRLPGEIVTAFLGHYSAIQAVCDDLDNIHSAAEGLPRFGQVQPESKVIWDFLPTIDWFWVRTGIKGALASVIALLLLRWIHPPGQAVIPLTAWVFTILSRPFVRAGGWGI